MVSSTQSSLLEIAKGDSDRPEWNQLLQSYEPFVRNTLAIMRVERSEIDDVCQQVLTRLWQELVNYQRDKSKARFRTWLTRLIRNVVINEYWKRKRAVRCEHLNFDFVEIGGGNPTEIDLFIESEWQSYVVSLALKRLELVFSGNAMEVFLRSEEGMPMEKICESLGISQQSAYVIKSRFKKRLVEEVSDIRKHLEFPDPEA